MWTGSGWECPQLLQIDGRWVLVVSVWEPTVPHYVAYAVGDLVDGRFIPGTWRRLTYGRSYYAPSAFRDEQGRPGLIHWLRAVDDPAGVWAGASSIPQLLTRVGDALHPAPHPAVAARRGNPQTLQPDRPTRLGGPVIDLEWAPTVVGDRLVVVGDDDQRRLDVVVSTDGLTVAHANGVWSMPWGGPVRLLLDIGVVEIYCGTAALAAPIMLVDPLTATLVGTGSAIAYPINAPG